MRIKLTKKQHTDIMRELDAGRGVRLRLPGNRWEIDLYWPMTSRNRYLIANIMENLTPNYVYVEELPRSDPRRRQYERSQRINRNPQEAWANPTNSIDGSIF